MAKPKFGEYQKPVRCDNTKEVNERAQAERRKQTKGVERPLNTKAPK